MNNFTKFGFGLLCCCISMIARVEELDKIVAIVNEGVILESELDLASRIAELTAVDDVPSKAELLENIVIRRIQLDLANRLNLYVSNEEQEEYIQAVLIQNNVTRPQYERELLKQGVSFAEWRQEVFNALLLRRLQQQQLRDYIRIEQDEIDTFLLDNPPALLRETRYDLVHALLPMNEISRAEVEDIVAQLSEPNDRPTITNRLSSVPFEDIQVNDFIIRGIAEMPDLFIREVSLMQSGDVHYFQSGSSWHIVKAIDVTYPSSRYRTEYKLSSIALLGSILYTEAQLKVRVDDIYSQLLMGRAFHELSETYFDTNSLLANYELDWVGIEVLPPRIQQQVVRLSIGKFSAPFLLENGWYILQVDDRRQRDITLDVLREQAYGVLANRKLRQSLPFWLNDIRSQAYVEYL